MKKTPVAKMEYVEYKHDPITGDVLKIAPPKWEINLASVMPPEAKEAMIMAALKHRDILPKTALMSVELEAQKRLPKLRPPEYYIVKIEHLLIHDSIRISVKVVNGEMPSNSYIYNVDLPVYSFELAAPGDWSVLDYPMQSVTEMIVKDKVKYILNERKQNELHRQAQQQESTQPWAVYELRDGTSSNSQADQEGSTHHVGS